MSIDPSGDPSGGAGTPSAIIDDCWNRIGIHGDQSCPKLPPHIHCRNCDVYERGAAALLDRITVDVADADVAIDAGQHEDRYRSVDARREGEPVLLFRVAQEWFGLPARFVNQVAEVSTIHSLPKLRSKAVLGLANVRGQLTVCVSLAHLLDLSGPGAGASQDARIKDASTRGTESGREDHLRATARFVVARDASIDRGRERRTDETTVFPVDEVHGIERFPRDAHRAVPATLAHAAAYHTRAMVDWRGISVGLLDSTLLFGTLRRSIG